MLVRFQGGKRVRKIGKIRWWDRRDHEGIIIDALGNEYYFNYAVTSPATLSRFKDDLLVEFEISTDVPYVSCAKNVTIVTSRAQKKAERTFIDQKQLQLGGI
jgi:hypothetical protein